MKTFFLLLLFFLLTKENILAQISDTSIVKDYELPQEAFRKWMKIDSTWMHDEYRNILNKYGIKLSCASCVYAYMKVEININSEGKITEYKIVKQNFCGKNCSKPMEHDIMLFFLKLIFPNELKNRKIEIRLGTGLSC